jgi:hypothetical protein
MNRNRTRPIGPTRKILVSAGGLALLALTTLSGPVARGQKEEPKSISPGVSACATCHSGLGGRRTNLFVTQYRSNEFIRLDESSTWLGQDTHSNAFKVLSGPLGQRMAKSLKLDVARSPQCLTCHAVDLTPTAPLVEKLFFVNQGVNCAGCHGLQEIWQVRHYQETPEGKSIPWRTLAPEQKAKAGMNDLRNPVVKAKLCVSCHVGDPERARVLTHAMFVAGHPALPPFEMATFIEGEPRHWGYPAELPYFRKVPADKTWALYRFHPADKEVLAARQVAAGAIAGLVAEARQLQANARQALAAGGGGLDFARLDCFACHHELLQPSDRQERTVPEGAPGRPNLRWAPVALAGVVARHAAGIEAGGLGSRVAGFQEKWLALGRSVTARPYGSPKRVLEASGEMIAWGEAVLEVLGSNPEPIYSVPEANRLRQMLGAEASGERTSADPEGALCVTWAYTTLSRGVRAPLAEERLKALGQVIPLTVRERPYFRMENGSMVPVTPRYPERMKAIGEFEAGAFLDPFRALLPAR